MYFQTSDTRIPLKSGDMIETAIGSRIIIDRHVGSGGFSLMYIAHYESSSRYLALKELFPRQTENLLIQRSEEGKIMIYDPADQNAMADHTALWQEFLQCFEREAAFTRKAGIVYDQTGQPVAQNSPDVLHAEGPFCDLKGNTYLSIDTYQGEPLRDLIERGFLRSDDGFVVSNRFLDDIMNILMETAVRLSALHAAGLWHLDLSPDNIYVVPSAGRTHLTPYIIDYGSAYDYNDPTHIADHQYACNPFAAPEIIALAQLQEHACGYAPDASSDTYAIASILFYAITGQIFNSEHRLNRDYWQEQIRREYAAGLPSHQGADSFAGSLIEFFDKWLTSSQRDRPHNPKELLSAIQSLRTKYRQYGNLLPLVEGDELMSYMVLEKYPLYQYLNDNGDAHVLCLGSGVFVRQMILSLISCGQMVNSHLYIHVVSNEQEETLRNYLRSVAPLLECYSNLKASSNQKYVTFSYHRVSDVLDEIICREVVLRYSDCRYILISLGSNRSNIEAARRYALQLTRLPNHARTPTILNYYCSEDAANNIYDLLDLKSLPDWLKVDAFGNNISAYSKVIRTLGLRTLKLSHLYNKLSNPNISPAESAKKLIIDEYSQRSSCAAALHIKYKLAGVGIILSHNSDKDSVISAYRKALTDYRFGEQLELEHRRWIMYMIADGYQVPTPAQLDRYGFETVDGEFNAFWRCKKKKLHPCLVPCSTVGVTLKDNDWERYSSLKAIEESPFDQLDKVSLTLHMRSGKKCKRILENNTIDSYFRMIDKKLSYAQTDLEENPNRRVDEAPFQTMRSTLNNIRDSICFEAKNLNYSEDKDRLTELQGLFERWDINISGEIDALRQILSIFAEYTKRRDYKKPDEIIINHLLWILYAESDITCIKLRGQTFADNIAGPLILEPYRLIFFGEAQHPEWDEFLHNHGNRGEIIYVPHCGNTLKQISSCLKRTVAQQGSCCIIDVTGADEQLLNAAQCVADVNSKVSLIRCTPDGHVQNLRRFPIAEVYTLNADILDSEIPSFNGASKSSFDSHYTE